MNLQRSTIGPRRPSTSIRYARTSFPEQVIQCSSDDDSLASYTSSAADIEDNPTTEDGTIVGEEIMLDRTSMLEVETSDGITWKRDTEVPTRTKKAWKERKERERAQKAIESPEIKLDIIDKHMPHDIRTAEDEVAYNEKLRVWRARDDDDDWDWKEKEREHIEEDKIERRALMRNSSQRIEGAQRRNSDSTRILRRDPQPSQSPVPSSSNQKRKRKEDSEEDYSEKDVTPSILSERPSRSTSRSANSSASSLRRRIVTRERIQAEWSKACKDVGAAEIRIVNDVDREPFPPVPANFVYLERNYRYTPDVPNPQTPEYRKFLVGCNCQRGGKCRSHKFCSCVRDSGCVDENNDPDVAYDADGLFRFSDYGEVIECNERCGCGSECRNRVAQKPRRLPLEIFKTQGNGWGVRCRRRIKRGTVLGFYTGEVVPCEDVSNMSEEVKNYAFDLDLHDSQHKYTVCSYNAGNWARFLNHSCDPNTIVYSVVFDTVVETYMPYIAYAALVDIPPLQEITFDYNPKAARQSNMSGPAASAGASKFQAFMNHPAGPKTVFFWAPLMKWCLVAAGLKDLNRPAEKLSVSQNVALAATGFIWVRYSLVITPVNYSLAAVNFFVGSTGLGQLYRIWDYRRKNQEAATTPAPA